MLQNLYIHSATTQREIPVVGSSIKKTVANYLSSFPCFIQPQAAMLGQDIPSSFGKDWIMFCPVLDIKEGDKVISPKAPLPTPDPDGVTFTYNSGTHNFELRQFTDGDISVSNAGVVVYTAHITSGNLPVYTFSDTGPWHATSTVLTFTPITGYAQQVTWTGSVSTQTYELITQDEYRVTGIKAFSFGRNPHMEVNIRAFKE